MITIMAKQSLEFTQSGNKYTASFVSAGTTVVQLEREYKAENNIGQLTVYAYIEGMNPVPVRNWTSYEASRNMIFQVDIPAGRAASDVGDYTYNKDCDSQESKSHLCTLITKASWNYCF